jgi:hypothetical protein
MQTMQDQATVFADPDDRAGRAWEISVYQAALASQHPRDRFPIVRRPDSRAALNSPRHVIKPAFDLRHPERADLSSDPRA